MDVKVFLSVRTHLKLIINGSFLRKGIELEMAVRVLTIPVIYNSLKNKIISQSIYFKKYLIYLFVWLCGVSVAACRLSSCSSVYGILVPQAGIERVSTALQGRFLTTGPPGKSPL